MTTQNQGTYLLLRSGEARKVGQRATGTINYDILTDSDRTKIFVRITGNDGGGYFSRKLIDFDKALECVSFHLDGTLPLPSKTLAPAFVGKSSNNAGFLAAVLRAEQLLDAAPGSDFQHVVSRDWKSWKAGTLKLDGTPLENPAPAGSPEAGNSHKGHSKGNKSKKNDAGGIPE